MVEWIRKYFLICWFISDTQFDNALIMKINLMHSTLGTSSLAQIIIQCTSCSLDGYLCKEHAQLATATILYNTEHIMHELKTPVKK